MSFRRGKTTHRQDRLFLRPRPKVVFSPFLTASLRIAHRKHDARPTAAEGESGPGRMFAVTCSERGPLN